MPISAAIPNMLLPHSWFPHEMQAEMLAAGIKTPVYVQGLKEVLGQDVPVTKSGMVCVPAFGEKTLRSIYEATGGNPIANINRDNLCIVMSPTIEGLSYTKAIHGTPVSMRNLVDEDDAANIPDEELDEVLYVEPGHLPKYFRENAVYAISTALDTVANMTDQSFEVVSAKLSPLSSGRGNVAVFLYFPNGCPFECQKFLDSGVFDATLGRNIDIRVIPRPVVMPNDEPQLAVEFRVKFLDVDNKLHKLIFPLLQNKVAQTFKNSNLRYIKTDKQIRSIVGVTQLAPGTPGLNPALVKSFKDAVARINFNPYVCVGVELKDTTVE